jgi:phenylpyruvate tautomerase PptA (4-oxalocrotonate tautomerase family)
VAVEAGKMPVVVVTGKRLSAQEKAQLAQQAS